jgi:uncharacterized protein
MTRNWHSTSSFCLSRSVAPIPILLCLILAVGCERSPSDTADLVVDQAELLDPEQRTRIEDFHGLLRADFDIDYRVVTHEETRDIDEYAVRLFETVGAGQLSRTGRGLLLLIDPTQDLVRLEVGYALEGTYPDAFIAYVEQHQMVPFFRAGRVADGILAATELIVTRAQRASTAASLESEVWLEGSGGAGASTSARIGDAPVDTIYSANTRLNAGTSPANVLAQYLKSMQNRDANPDLDIYTPATQRMLRRWVMTPAQMDNIVTTYRGCHAETERVDSNRRYGVIRYPVTERQCAPWFFENVDGVWALDLTMMQLAIRFGRDNSWHFDRNAAHPYEYAFEDWPLDSRGYPHQKK